MEDWLSLPFKELALSTGNGINPYEFPDEEFELYSVPAHQTGEPEIVTGKTIGSNKQLVFEGMVLLCKINPRINRTWLVRPATGRRQIASTEWIVFSRHSCIIPRYLMYFMRNSYFWDFLSSNASGVGGSLMRVKPSAFSDYIFRTTGLKTQLAIIEKIEELLSGLDAAVAGLNRIKTNLKRYRASVLQAAVEGRLTAEWRRHHPPSETGEQLLARILKERRAKWEENQFKKYAEQGRTPPKNWREKYPEPVKPDTTGLPELPEGWKYCGIDEILKYDRNAMKTGPFGSLLKKVEHRSNGVPVLGIENIEAMRFVVGSKIHVDKTKAAELCGYRVEPKDLVISRSGTVGEICVIPDDIGEAIISTNLMKISLAPQGMIPMFFCCLFNGSPIVLRQIHDLCKGSTRDFLNQDILKKLTFPLPSLSEQNEILSEISRRISIADAAEKTIDSALKRAARLRQSILKRAFEGRLVPQDPNDEPASALLERIRAERLNQADTVKSARAKRKGKDHQAETSTGENGIKGAETA